MPRPQLLPVGSLLMLTIIILILVPFGEQRVGSRKAVTRPKVKVSQEAILEEKYDKLVGINWGPFLIELTEEDFENLIVQTPRNYSAFVLFNEASNECSQCKKARHNLNDIRLSYRYQEEKQPKTFFIEVLNDRIPESLLSYGVSTPNPPALIYFPEYGRLENLEEMDVQRYQYNKKDLLSWIEKICGVRIKMLEEFSIEEYLPTVFLFFVSIVTVYKHWESLKTFLENDTNVAVILMAVVLFCVSGFTYNSINGSLLLGGSSRETLFIHPATNDQFIVESFIIFFMYGMMSYGMILLTQFGSYPAEVQARCEFVFYVAIGFFSVPFFFLYSIFTKKLM